MSDDEEKMKSQSCECAGRIGGILEQSKGEGQNRGNDSVNQEQNVCGRGELESLRDTTENTNAGRGLLEPQVGAKQISVKTKEYNLQSHRQASKQRDRLVEGNTGKQTVKPNQVVSPETNK